MFEHIIDKFSTVYVPEQNITVDESLMPFRGRLSWKQYIPSKRSRFGIKFFMLCESSSGYIWKSVIYTGKETLFDKEFENYGLSTKSVLSLIKPLLNKGYCLTTDNFYTSPELSQILIENKTDIYGTVKPNRKGMPPLLKGAKLKKNDIIAFQKGKMIVMKWKDKKEVCMLSTIHDGHIVTEVRKGKTVSKPNIVMDYNKTMGGVDRADQRLVYYPSIRKGQKKYYKKIFRHLLDLSILNSFVLYKKNSGTKDHIDFRLSLIEKIIGIYHTQSQLASHGKYFNSSISLRLTERHFPSYVPPTSCKTEPRRRCIVCSSKRNDDGKRVRKESRYMCKDCDVGLCIIPCFQIYHTKEDY